MLKMTASFVLTSFRPQRTPEGTPPGPHSLRPRWTAILSILLLLWHYHQAQFRMSRSLVLSSYPQLQPGRRS